MMKTNETINKYRRGDDYDAEKVISYVCSQLEIANESNDLLPEARKRGDYFNSQKYVGCSRKNLENKSETAFSRALFNQKFLSINGHLTVILDYEAVLSADKAQKVDLLAFNLVENKLIAVEYKYNPKGNETGIEYGLIEAYCYGYLLDKYIRNNHDTIKSSIIKKLDQLNLPYLKDIISDKKITSEFILSAPVSYFLEFTKDSKRAEKRFNRIISLEEILTNKRITKTNSTFGGYLPIAEISHKRQTVISKDDGENTFPFIMAIIEGIENIKETNINL